MIRWHRADHPAKTPAAHLCWAGLRSRRTRRRSRRAGAEPAGRAARPLSTDLIPTFLDRSTMVHILRRLGRSIVIFTSNPSGHRMAGSTMSRTCRLAPASRPLAGRRVARVVRPRSCIELAGGSPVPVGIGAPGSRPRFVVERWRAERGVESLFGGSKRAGRSAVWCESCSLVTVTMGEPSRSHHGEGHARRTWFRLWSCGVFPGYGERHVRIVRCGTGEARPGCPSGKDPRYKPMVKSDGGQRESDGVVVPLIGGRNTAGGKGPDFDHACGEGKRQGMTGVSGPTTPVGCPARSREGTAGAAASGEGARTSTQAMGCGQAVFGAAFPRSVRPCLQG